MTGAALESHSTLVTSIAAVWKSYLDQQSAALAAAMRPWEISAGPSRLWEPYREAAAFAIARLLTKVAREPFARLYKSSLVRHPSGEMDFAQVLREPEGQIVPTNAGV